MRHRSLLVVLILTWAVSWPVIKVGVSSISPLWYACLRYQIAAVCLFTLVVIRREFVFPTRPDWPLVVVSGVFQMGAYSALTSLALTTLPPGRASVLGGRHLRASAMSMALLATPCLGILISALTLGETVGRSLVAGVVMIGAGIRLATMSSHSSGAA